MLLHKVLRLSRRPMLLALTSLILLLQLILNLRSNGQTELEHITIGVTNLSRSIHFYSRILQLQPAQRPGFPFPGAFFSLNSSRQTLHLVQRDGWTPHSEIHGAHIAFPTANLQADRHRLAALGYPAIVGPMRPDGAQQIYIKDPDGNTWEFVQQHADVQSIHGSRAVASLGEEHQTLLERDTARELTTSSQDACASKRPRVVATGNPIATHVAQDIFAKGIYLIEWVL